MFSIRRSCQSALQTSRYVCLYAHGARRAFSHSPAHSRGALPNFLPPSSPELSSLLSTFNSKVLLPYHLTKEQQKLVYSQEARAKLEAEPVEITLGDVTLPLEHLDRNKLPDRWYTLRDIVKNSETKEDWENVVRCLEGFEEAGIKVKWQWQSMVVRRLNFAGMQHLVLKAIQRPKATGIRLSNWDVLVQVLRTVHDQAAMTNWEQEDTMKALKMANQVVELMENKEHCGGQITPTKGHGDWRGHPAVIALPTEMAAVVAEKYGGDKEAVKKMANRLVAAIKQNDYMATVDSITTHLTQSPGDFQNIPSMSGSVLDYCHELFELTVVWNALKTSRKVLGANMPSATEAQQYEAKLEQAIMDGVNKLKNLKAPNGEPFESEMGEYIVEMVGVCK